MYYEASAEWRLDSGNRQGVTVGITGDDARDTVGQAVWDALNPTQKFMLIQRRAEMLCALSVARAGGMSKEFMAQRLRELDKTYPDPTKAAAT